MIVTKTKATIPTNVAVKKLIVVLATSLLVIVINMKNNSQLLEKVPYIYYLLHFQKNWRENRALIDLGSEVNIITPA